MYFVTTPTKEHEKEFSERFCIDDATKTKFDGNDGVKDVKNVTIPLWNVKRIETNVLDVEGVTDMTFHRRYTNFSTPDGYYTA
jgi:hypothetical protein